jgi:alpha-1,2-mannosyltransferase
LYGQFKLDKRTREKRLNFFETNCQQIWWNSNVNTVFPPVDVNNLLSFPIENRELKIISVGQFRPEKNHKLQIRSFADLLKKTNKKVKLILLGGSRDQEDEERINELKSLVKDLNIESNVEFEINASNQRLTELLSSSLIGLHTMRCEHFGICIVEYQAAGLITLAHCSGGPLTDIIQPGETGYLATTQQEYSERMTEIINSYEEEKEKYFKIQRNGRKSSQRFSEQVFEEESIRHLSLILV